MGTRILIAEDEPFIVESLAFLLKREGYEVDSVSDGAEVIKSLHLTGPDLLILDIMLPSTNGFDILSQIRATPSLADLPILALTAKGQEADRQRMINLGANRFMTKPFSNKELVESVAVLLAERDGRDKKTLKAGGATD